jgi:hypothetical protein
MLWRLHLNKPLTAKLARHLMRTPNREKEKESGKTWIESRKQNKRTEPGTYGTCVVRDDSGVSFEG